MKGLHNFYRLIDTSQNILYQVIVERIKVKGMDNNYLIFNVIIRETPTYDMSEPLTVLNDNLTSINKDADSLINAAKSLANFLINNQGYIQVVRSVSVLNAECKPEEMFYNSYIVYMQEYTHGDKSIFYKENDGEQKPLLTLNEGRNFIGQAKNFYYTDKEFDVESLIAQAILRQALFNNRLVNVVMPEELEKINEFINMPLTEQHSSTEKR